MLFDEGDDDASPMGPPPDPSVRQWRHPSEIAAANAAMQAETSSGRSWPVLPILGGCAIGILSLFALRTTFDTSSVGSAAQASLTPSVLSASGVAVTADLTTTTLLLAPRSTAPAEPFMVDPTPPAGSSGLIAIWSNGQDERLSTGIVVDNSVLTSASALGDRSSVTLQVADGTVDGVVIGVDQFSDLAVITVPDADLARLPAPLELTDATPLRAGDVVTLWRLDMAENPAGVAGHLMATDQQISTADGPAALDVLTTSIDRQQFGPGGVLLDADGRAAAMVIDGETVLCTGVPLSTLLDRASVIRSTGVADRAWLGISGRDLDPGFEITSVEAGGPADVAGLQVGDQILHIDETPITSMADLVGVLRRADEGSELTITVRRGDVVIDQTISVGLRPSSDA